MKAMGGINAAIDGGKHQLEVALGSKGELLASPISHAQLRVWPSGSLS
jgi:hypothetical protein